MTAFALNLVAAGGDNDDKEMPRLFQPSGVIDSMAEDLSHDILIKYDDNMIKHVGDNDDLAKKLRLRLKLTFNLHNPVRTSDESTITKLQELVASRKGRCSIRHEQMQELFEAAAKANLRTLKLVEPSFPPNLGAHYPGLSVRYAVYTYVEAKEAIDLMGNEIKLVYEVFAELDHSGAAKAPDPVLRELWLLEAGRKSTKPLRSPVQQQQKLLVIDGLSYDLTDPMGFRQRAELAKPHASQQGDNDGQAWARRRKAMSSITCDIGDMVDELFGDIYPRPDNIRFEIGPQGWHFGSHAQTGPRSPSGSYFGAQVGAQRSEAATKDDDNERS
ncbi:hypothetical protein DL767_005406 [Monosporascus sp. MG133]|nr:hypothetical protein DL767_005406 [Monosporascus sp. MG133]